MIATLSVQITK